LSDLASKKPVRSKAIDADVVMADEILPRFQKTPNIKFSAFEYFEPVQDVPLPSFCYKLKNFELFKVNVF